MDRHNLAQFLAAAVLVLMTPGPVMAIVAHNTLRHGTTAGLFTAIGVELGEACLLVAFLPQFIDPHHPVAEQMGVLGAVYVCTALAFDCACVLAVARIRFPAGWERIGRFAEPASAAVYLSIAIVMQERNCRCSRGPQIVDRIPGGTAPSAQGGR